MPAYTFALLLFGAGLLAAWTYRAPADAARPCAAGAAPRQEVDGVPPGTVHLGTLVRLVDCRWTDPEHAVGNSRLGRFDLTSGLAELAFDGGATVILEGPVLFIADSPSGGFLSHGKATVRVDRPRAGATAGSGHAPIGRPQAGCGLLFCIRTPTANVVDRGNARFTLQVDRSRASYVKVLGGKLDFQCRLDRVLSFKEGDWAFVEPKADRSITVNYSTGGKRPETLTRRLPPGVPVFTVAPRKEQTRAEQPLF
jgi:hypothetical protein